MIKNLTDYKLWLLNATQNSREKCVVLQVIVIAQYIKTNNTRSSLLHNLMPTSVNLLETLHTHETNDLWCHCTTKGW